MTDRASRAAEVIPDDGSGPEVRRQLQRMASLAEIDLHGGSLHDVLGRIAKVTTELLPADAGASVILWDPAGERFTAASSTVAGHDDELPAERARRSGGATRWVIDNRERIVVEDVADDPFGANEMTVEYGVGSYVGTPLLVTGHCLGVLYALAAEPRHWEPDDLSFLDTLAARAAGAIDAARLTEEARLARERAEALSHVANALIGISTLADVLQTIVDGVAASVAADHATLLTRGLEGRPAEGHVVVGGRPVDSTDGEYQQVLEYVRTLVAGAELAIAAPAAKTQEEFGEHSDVGAVVVAPLRYQGRRIGILAALRTADQADFAPEDASLLTVMASQAVVAIENARLVQETQEALAELSAVYEIVQAQNTEGGLDDMLAAIAEAVASALPAHAVSLTVVDPQGLRVSRIVGGGRAREEVDVERSYADLLAGPESEALRVHRASLSAGDGAGGPQLIVPLVHRGMLVGILSAKNPVGHDPFVKGDLELATVMGSQIAVAIANARLFDETQRLAITDALTGMNNRRHLFTLAERAFGAAQRYGRSLACVMLDLDHFKEVNDTYGHGVGDEVLRAVADRLRAGIREVDILGRYGGEEFALVLPETDQNGSIGVAERLRKSIGGMPVETSAGPLQVTVSAGVAELGPETPDMHGLLDRADAALLFAKRLGRNRVQAI